MKNRLIAAFGNDLLEHKENINYPQIHVIDLSRITNSGQGIEVRDTKPEDIATLLIKNPNLNISATFFKPQCFKDDATGKEPDNCEGVFYLSGSTDKTWILFLEIKDCDSTNVSVYFKKAKKQIVRTVQLFRDKNIIAPDKRVYANISFPRREKVDYFNHLIKHPEKKEFLDKYKIFMRGTNQLVIKNNTTID